MPIKAESLPELLRGPYDVTEEQVALRGLRGVRPLRSVPSLPKPDIDTAADFQNAPNHLSPAELFDSLDNESEDEQTEASDNPEPAQREAAQTYKSDIVDHILQGAGKHSLLSAADEVRLAKQIERGDLTAKKTMTESNIRLVISIALDFQGKGVPIEDLIQDGTVGLMTAVDKFDWRKEFKFSTYATWWIRQAVQRSLGNHGRIIRTPNHVIDRTNKINSAQAALTAEKGRVPTDDEIIEQTNILPHHYHEAKEATYIQPNSLNTPLKANNEPVNGVEFGDLISDETLGEEEVIEKVAVSILGDTLNNALDSLDPNEKKVVILRFGLSGEEAFSQEKTSHHLRLTTQRVRELEKSAIEKLTADAELQSAKADPDNFTDIVERNDQEETYKLDDKIVSFSQIDLEIFKCYKQGKTRKETAELLQLELTYVKHRAARAYGILGVRAKGADLKDKARLEEVRQNAIDKISKLEKVNLAEPAKA